jgi:hypothetical protein
MTLPAWDERYKAAQVVLLCVHQPAISDGKLSHGRLDFGWGRQGSFGVYVGLADAF